MNKLEKGLLLEAALSFGLALLMFYVAGFDSAIFLLYLPFDLIGKGLRWLSLSSFAGNIAALILYAVLSLIPMIYLITIRAKSGTKRVDVLLPFISIYSFYMLYQFINPGFMLNRMPQTFKDMTALPFIKLSYSIIFYILIAGYLIFRMLGTITMKDTSDKIGSLCKQLQKILIFLCIFYTFFYSYFAAFQMFDKFKSYTNQNSAPINFIFVAAAYILEGLPILFSILILISGVLLLRAIILNHMQEEEITAASRMGLVSRQAVYVTFLSNLALNVLQFLLSRQLNDTNYSMEISLFPLIIAFSAMILSGYFKETKKLHDDNEMII
jgi:hypothetical protein